MLVLRFWLSCGTNQVTHSAQQSSGAVLVVVTTPLLRYYSTHFNTLVDFVSTAAFEQMFAESINPNVFSVAPNRIVDLQSQIEGTQSHSPCCDWLTALVVVGGAGSCASLEWLAEWSVCPSKQIHKGLLMFRVKQWCSWTRLFMLDGDWKPSGVYCWSPLMFICQLSNPSIPYVTLNINQTDLWVFF